MKNGENGNKKKRKHTLRYARTCFLAPITQGNNLVLSPTAINNNPPASSSSFLDTLDGVDGRDLIKCRRVEKWDRRRRDREGFDLFWFSLLGSQLLFFLQSVAMTLRCRDLHLPIGHGFVR